MRNRIQNYLLLAMALFICIAEAPCEESQKVWIFLKDKGSHPLAKNALEMAKSAGISDRALDRRKRGLSEDRLIDESDFPVFEGYLSALSARGIVPIVVSKWLNAVSAEVSLSDIPEIESLPFVRDVRSVAFATAQPPAEERYVSASKISGTHSLNYGPSLDQNEMMRVPQLHDLDLSGKRILIGLIDTGFNHAGRDVFQALDVVAEHDFVCDDDTTANQEGDPADEQNHGTQVLSVIGGYLPGVLIGPAYRADYALAKTEDVDSELRVEEDRWVAGIEWLESIGCDVVSTSLGYNFFDDGFSYAYSDLDGSHCVTTLAADIAAQKGVVVVSSAGNEGNNSWKYITSPADGREVIAVGAVYPDGEITGFSSVGPTSDGRVKPDVMAMGSSVVAISPSSGSKFTHSFVSGTSFSAPLVAGVCALILEAHPGLRQEDVREILKQTADRAANPDTLYGWGIVNAFEAVFHPGPILRNFQFVSDVSQSRTLFNLEMVTRNDQPPDRVVFYYRQTEALPFDSLRLSPSNSESPFHYQVDMPPQLDISEMSFYISVTDDLGKTNRSPYHAPDQVFTLSDTTGPDVPIVIDLPDELVLHPIYPNPFNASAHIVFELPDAAFVKLTIFNLLGQEAAVLIDRELSAGKKEILWDGRDEAGLSLSSGIYYCMLDVGFARQIRKMVMVR